MAANSRTRRSGSRPTITNFRSGWNLRTRGKNVPGKVDGCVGVWRIAHGPNEQRERPQSRNFTLLFDCRGIGDLDSVGDYFDLESVCVAPAKFSGVVLGHGKRKCGPGVPATVPQRQPRGLREYAASGGEDRTGQRIAGTFANQRPQNRPRRAREPAAELIGPSKSCKQKSCRSCCGKPPAVPFLETCASGKIRTILAFR